MFNIYAYVDGSDLDDCSDGISKAIQEFISENPTKNLIFISDHQERTPDLKPDDLPQWNLGINLTTERLTESAAEELVSLLMRISGQFSREFVIGIWNPASKTSEDILFVGSKSPNSTAKELVELLHAF